MKKIKAIVTKVGLDSHERGARLVAAALRDAGMEVIYLGSFQTPEGIIQTALQEDVDLIGVSCHCGEHLTLMPVIMDLLKANNIPDVPVILGGVIPREEVDDLKKIGVKEVFGYGTTMDQVVEFVKQITN
jgi:methylmalonyl-CoA mutase C-terminal domain/subunit